MTEIEKNIFADMYHFTHDHGMPPPKNTKACDVYWQKMHDDAIQLIGGKYQNYPLAVEMMIAIINYREEQGHAVNRKRGLE